MSVERVVVDDLRVRGEQQIDSADGHHRWVSFDVEVGFRLRSQGLSHKDVTAAVEEALKGMEGAE